MSLTSPLDPLIELIADRVAAKVVDAIGQRAPERVRLADLPELYGVSPRWAKEHKLTIRGPRGARFVLRDELEESLSTETIRRRTRPVAPAVDTAREVVVSLAARRAKAS